MREAVLLTNRSPEGSCHTCCSPTGNKVTLLWVIPVLLKHWKHMLQKPTHGEARAGTPCNTHTHHTPHITHHSRTACTCAIVVVYSVHSDQREGSAGYGTHQVTVFRRTEITHTSQPSHYTHMHTHMHTCTHAHTSSHRQNMDTDTRTQREGGGGGGEADNRPSLTLVQSTLHLSCGVSRPCDTPAATAAPVWIIGPSCSMHGTHSAQQPDSAWMCHTA